jgi:hypothetical protein
MIISTATTCCDFALVPEHEQDNKPNLSSFFTPIKQWKRMTMMCVVILFAVENQKKKNLKEGSLIP